MKEKFTFFWKEESPFSQWYRSAFIVDDEHFNCAEQYMMYRKAILFENDEIAKKILAAKSPRAQKTLGREVQGFDVSLWSKASWEIVMTGNRAKFTQSETLKKALLATAGTTLVEASPRDRIWGVGLSENDPRINDREKWRGENRLGEILTQLRDEILRVESKKS